MEWAPVVIKEIISAFKQQNSSQDNEKLKNIIREVMAENVSRDQNNLLCEILNQLNRNSVREVDRTTLEREQLKEEYEKLTRGMERLLRQDKHMEKKQESVKELSLRQKMLLQKVNELNKDNAGKGRSRSKHRNADGDGRRATNQSQGQQQGQPHSRGAISKFKNHPAMKGNSNDGFRVPYGSQNHPFPLINDQNTYSQAGQSTGMNAFQQYHGAGVDHRQYQGQQVYQGARGGQQQYRGARGGHQQYQGAGSGHQHYQGQQQYRGPEGGQYQYSQPNPLEFSQYQQKSQISQPYSPNPGQPHQLYQDRQQQQVQFGSSESNFQQPGGHQQFHYRGPFNNRGQIQHRGRGQLQQRGQLHHRGGYHQRRDNFLLKDKMQINEDIMNQFTPEELNALKEILQQKKQRGQEEENRDTKPVSQTKTTLKKKQKKRQGKTQPKKGENSNAEKVDDSDSDNEDDLDEVKKKAQSAFKAQLEAEEKEKNKAVKDGQGDTEAEKPKAQNIEIAEEATENKAEVEAEAAKETSTAFNLCVASGLDMSKLREGPEWDALLSSMVLVAKTGDQTATCQPKRVSEVIEFKKKYPNAEILVLK